MNPVDKFGSFLVSNLRDRALRQHAMLQERRLVGPGVKEPQDELATLTQQQKQLVARIVTDALDTALHDLAAALQESHDTNDGVEVLVDGENVAALSGMLQGEVPGEGGWIDRFSSFGPFGEPRSTAGE